jgi:hypothetical protein
VFAGQEDAESAAAGLRPRHPGAVAAVSVDGDFAAVREEPD